MKITVMASGRRYDLARPFPFGLDLPAGATVDDALAALQGALGSWGPPPSALLAVSGEHLGTVAEHESQRLAEADELLIFAPVASG